MTVQSKTPRRQYEGTGSVTVYPYDWRILAAADLAVIQTDSNGIEYDLLLDVDYTVSGAGNNDGGSVTLSTPLPSGHLITIFLDMDIEQPDDLTNQSSPFLDSIELMIDRLAIIAQQLSDQMSRTLTHAASAPAGVSGWLPAPAADSILAWNHDATALINFPASELGALTIGDNTIQTSKYQNDSVTYAKMQNVSVTKRLIGRNTAGAGDPQEVSISQALDWLSVSFGAIPCKTLSDWTCIEPVALGGKVLTTSQGAIPSWKQPATSMETVGLSIYASGSSHEVSWSARNIVLRDLTGGIMALHNVSTVANLNTTGLGGRDIEDALLANSQYFMWAICNDSGQLSTMFTEPLSVLASITSGSNVISVPYDASPVYFQQGSEVFGSSYLKSGTFVVSSVQSGSNLLVTLSTKAIYTGSSVTIKNIRPPVVPYGYDYCKRIGVVCTDNASKYPYAFTQKGKVCKWISGGNRSVLPTLSSGIVGTYSTTAPTFAAVDALSMAIAPITAIAVELLASSQNAASCSVLASPENLTSVGGIASLSPAPLVHIAQQAPTRDWLQLISPVIWIASQGASSLVQVSGWEDSI